MTPAESLAEKVRAGKSAALEIRRPQSAASNRASEMGHKCERFLVLRRTKGEDASVMSRTVASLLEEGDIHERDVKRRLYEMGVTTAGAQRSFPPNRYELTGHVDCVYEMAAKDGTVVEVGIEIKSLNPTHWGRLRDGDARSLLDCGISFIRKWYVQGQIYMFLSDVAEWLFIVKNKMSGEWKVLVMCQDLDFVEGIVDTCERVNRHVLEGTEPPPISDPRECRRCRFFQRACDPNLDYGEGMAFLSDDDIVELSEEILAKREPSAEFKFAWSQMHDIAKQLCGDREEVRFVAGDAMFEGRKDARGALRLSVTSLEEKTDGPDTEKSA